MYCTDEKCQCKVSYDVLMKDKPLEHAKEKCPACDHLIRDHNEEATAGATTTGLNRHRSLRQLPTICNGCHAHLPPLSLSLCLPLCVCLCLHMCICVCSCDVLYLPSRRVQR